jgi:3-methyladenine DNA glycosylase/8-oxoguanine DNA glycosylase
MAFEFHIEYPENFSFRHTAISHGWYDLLPFAYAEEAGELRHVFIGKGGPAAISVREGGGRLLVTADGGAEQDEADATVRHILRLDDDLSGFYTLAEADPRLKWAADNGAGRLLRSPTVWEDLVKTICTTNCSWGLTRKMVENLVGSLGEEAPGGGRAFPTPAAMAGVSVEFYRDTVRAGYRSPYFVELAGSVASGKVDPESWLHSELETADLKKEIKRVKGAGDYAAENLLKLLGRYDGLSLDSWLRAGFYKAHNGGKVCDDKKIERHYRKFGPWRGLAIWCDMTERWFD